MVVSYAQCALKSVKCEFDVYCSYVAEVRALSFPSDYCFGFYVNKSF